MQKCDGEKLMNENKYVHYGVENAHCRDIFKKYMKMRNLHTENANRGSSEGW